MIERTLVLIKPDGVQRQLVGRIIQKFEDTGLKIVGIKFVLASKELALKHYDEDVAKRRGEAIRQYNVNFITEGPVVAIVLEGVNAVEIVRKIVGPTEPKTAPPGTIRGDFAHVSYAYADSKKSVIRNLIHASGDLEFAKKEISLWFRPEELHSYKTVHEKHIF